MHARRVLFLAAAAVIALLAVREPALHAPLPLRASREPLRIEIRRPREDLILTRDPGGPWVIARLDDLADAEAVDALLDGLRALTFGPTAAPAGAGLASGLGPADAMRVRVLDGAGQAMFDGLFGRRLFGRSAYFQAKAGDEVRVANGVDPELLTRPNAAWREPRLLPHGCPDGLEYLVRGEWRRVAADDARVLCALRATHWASVADYLLDFGRPLLSVRAPDGRGFTVGPRSGTERLVRVEGRSALIKIPAVSIETATGDMLPSQR